jgi:Family of unknown function (DUF5906)/RepB DNA-primase N-terminal domain/Primase C terminal 1 (PriCT-1)
MPLQHDLRCPTGDHAIAHRIADDKPMSDAAPISQFPVLDREAACTFLKYLDPDADNFTFQTFTDSNDRKKTYQKNPRTGQISDGLAKVLHGSLDEHWAALVDLSRQGAGIFVTVNKTTLCGRRNQENITEVRAYFSDCDGVPQDIIKDAVSLLGLTPHIVTQTSPGNYHLLWCVDGAPLTDFPETQRKLAALVRSDPHVSDLPRVMRLPGFPHQKDGSAGELVRVLHLHDGDNYSNTDFQRALAQALALSTRPKRRLAETTMGNLGPAPPNWHEGFSEGSRNDECARRAGSCLAQGMSEKETLEKCLAWNKENNRPPLSDEEVTATVASIARTHARKNAAAPDEGPHDEKGESTRITWAELRAEWIYVTAQEVFIRRSDPKATMFGVRAFANMFAYLKRDLEITQSIANYIFSRPPGQGVDTFTTFCYMPGQPENYNGDLNLWRPSFIAPKQGNAQWFLDHLQWLFGADSKHVLNWCAWVYQHQDQHPKHALVTQGEIQGTGKSVVANVMKRLLGTANCTILDQGALDLQHDGWKVRTKLILIEEVRPAFGSSNALAKKLHPLISEDTVHVDMKNRNDFDMPNVIAGLFGSNKPDALTMDDSDRRYLIVSTDREGKVLKPKERTYYRALYGQDGTGGKINDHDALAAVAWELQRRNLEGYSAQDPAPRTIAKVRMIEAAGSELQKWLIESDAVRGHKLVAVDKIVHQVPIDIDRRHRGNLRTDIADVLRRKFNGVPVKNQIRPYGKAGGKLRVWALGKDAESTAGRAADELAARLAPQRTTQRMLPEPQSLKPHCPIQSAQPAFAGIYIRFEALRL